MIERQMMEAINFFNSVEHLEPKCPKCQNKIEYDITTEWNDQKNAHMCLKCGEVIR